MHNMVCNNDSFIPLSNHNFVDSIQISSFPQNESDSFNIRINTDGIKIHILNVEKVIYKATK